MKKLLILSLLALAVLASCGKKGTAKSTVEKFLSENLAAGAPTGVSIERFDSTNFVVDSIITQLHQSAEASSIYKKGVNYGTRPQKQKLVWATVSFEANGQQQKHTFYLNRECSQVIAVKP